MPWRPDLLRPLVTGTLKHFERKDLAGIVEKAIPIGPEAVAMVKTDGGWPEPGKLAINENGPQALADFLNSLGISAENSPLALTIIGAGAILVSRSMLVGKLEELARKKEEAKIQPEAKP